MVRSLKESDSGGENTDNGNRLHGNKKAKIKKTHIEVFLPKLMWKPKGQRLVFLICN